MFAPWQSQRSLHIIQVSDHWQLINFLAFPLGGFQFIFLLCDSESDLDNEWNMFCLYNS